MKRFLKTLIGMVLAASLVLSFAFTAACSDGKDPNVAAAEETYVVKNGDSTYKIVYPANAAECVEFAAEELQSFIRQITGVTLPVIDDTNVVVNNRARYISVGKTKLWEASGLTADIKELNGDGFRLVTDNNLIYLCGCRDRATLYAVYDFLEKYGGVRFYAADYTYVPTSENLTIPALNETEIPAFQLRNYYSGYIFEDPLFDARKRIVTSESREIADYGYSMAYDFYDPIHNSVVLLTQDYVSSHPEFYAQRDGKVIYNINGEAQEICWTNGITDEGTLDTTMELSTAKLIIEAMKQCVLDHPTARYFMIGQQDSMFDYCSCPRCKAVMDKYGGNFSANIVRFMNVVAREMQAWADAELDGREINMVTFAYAFSEAPPVTIDQEGNVHYTDDQVVCADNLVIRIATASCNLYYPLEEQSYYVNVFKGWSALCDRFMIWDYTTNFEEYLFYIPNFRTLKQNLQFYRDLGAIYVMNQGDYTENESWQGKAKTYISAKLLWDPDLSVEALLEEFLVGYYGAYAPAVRDTIYDFEDRISYMLESDDYRPAMVMGGVGKYMHFQYSTWPIRLLETCEERLEAAIESARADESLTDEEREAMVKRLTTVLLTPQRMILYNYQSYYGAAGLQEYAQEFLANCKLVDLTRVGTLSPEDAVRNQYGI